MYGLAGGRQALLGEAGRPEGVLPLARLSNGDLGVQVAGGGSSGGRGVQVTNNITIQGGAAGKGGMDAQSQRDLERQIENSVRAGVMRVLADEKRQGGMLYGS